MALGRWTSRLLQLLGFAGLVVCIALAIGLLLGRSWVGVAVGDVFVAADTSISNGLASIDDATGRLSEGAGRLEELVGELSPLAASAPVPAAVAARISTVVDAYAPARDRYIAAREHARSALQSVQLAARVVPGVQLPTDVSNVLVAADDRLTGIDAALSDMRAAARATAGDVAAAATRLRDTTATAAETARSLRAGVDDLRIRIADVHVTVDRVLWLGTGAVLAIVGYVALLNILIIWLARRRPKAAPATDAGAMSSEV